MFVVSICYVIYYTVKEVQTQPEYFQNMSVAYLK